VSDDSVWNWNTVDGSGWNWNTMTYKTSKKQNVELRHVKVTKGRKTKRRTTKR
jgi:hypothetical protein